jgi:pyruvate formate lyase activating enzyme
MAIMSSLSRRDFLLAGAAVAATPFVPDRCWPLFDLKKDMPAESEDIRGKIFRGDAPNTLWKWSREGFLYQKLGGNKVVCGICPNRCILAPGDRSVCRSKVNLNGILYSLAYGNPCAVNIDPIEKKPLYHFKPQSKAFSIAAAGCNFRCLNCQNWEISQSRPEDLRSYELFPAQVAEQAAGAQTASIAYTYSEATTFFEYMIDTAKIAREKGLANLWISNGFINASPLQTLCDVLDAANINLKSFKDATYRKLNGGRLAPVLRTLKILHERKVHLEITTLVVPEYVDDEEMIKAMCGWILENLGPDHPLHFLRFFPQYKLDRLPPTPVSVLTRFRTIAMQQGIRYVFVGNVPNHEGNHTYCHVCGSLLIKRNGYSIAIHDLVDGRCRHCNARIPGVW